MAGARRRNRWLAHPRKSTTLQGGLLPAAGEWVLINQNDSPASEDPTFSSHQTAPHPSVKSVFLAPWGLVIYFFRTQLKCLLVRCLLLLSQTIGCSVLSRSLPQCLLRLSYTKSETSGQGQGKGRAGAVGHSRHGGTGYHKMALLSHYCQSGHSAANMVFPCFHFLSWWEICNFQTVPEE